MKLYPVLGNSQLLDGGAMFGNAPKAVWQGWSPPDEKNRIKLACRALLLQRPDGKYILFETGIGIFFEPKLKDRFGVVEDSHVLLENLKTLGVGEEDIHAVVLSHLHFDHAGGLLSGPTNSRLLFPNAKYYVGEEHWKRAQKPHPRDRASFVPVLNELLSHSGRLTLVKKDGLSDLAPLVTFHFSDGHTPGLMLARLHLDSGPLVFASDLIPGFPWVHVPISMGYDRFPELLIDEKQNLLDDLISKNGKLYFTHDPVHACGVVRRDEKGKYFAEPIAVETLV